VGEDWVGARQVLRWVIGLRWMMWLFSAREEIKSVPLYVDERIHAMAPDSDIAAK
jgi:hypothetical protein